MKLSTGGLPWDVFLLEELPLEVVKIYFRSSQKHERQEESYARSNVDSFFTVVGDITC